MAKKPGNVLFDALLMSRFENFATEKKLVLMILINSNSFGAKDSEILFDSLRMANTRLTT